MVRYTRKRARTHARENSNRLLLRNTHKCGLCEELRVCVREEPLARKRKRGF